MNEYHISFFEALDCLDAGGRAALRRSAGKMLSDADGRALTAFYRCLPYGVQNYQEDRWFAVACLRCLWDAGENSKDSLQKILRGVSQNELISDSATARIEALIDTQWDSDGYMLMKLNRVICLVRQKTDRELPNMSELLDDLLSWNREDQRVQKKWAKEIFSNIREEKEN